MKTEINNLFRFGTVRNMANSDLNFGNIIVDFVKLIIFQIIMPRNSSGFIKYFYRIETKFVIFISEIVNDGKYVRTKAICSFNINLQYFKILTINR